MSDNFFGADTGAAQSILNDAMQDLDLTVAGRFAVTQAATTGNNITLSGAQTIDGYTPINGELILVKDQTDSKQNGIYVYSTTGTWNRWTLDNTKMPIGSGVSVQNGTLNASTLWVSGTSNPAGFVWGNSPVNFYPFASTKPLVETYTATAGQTVFPLQNAYAVGNNVMEVSINGIVQYLGDSYTETDSKTITFLTAMDGGERVRFKNLLKVSGILANLNGLTSSQKEIQTATQGQTVFTLTSMTYAPGTNTLAVVVNGVYMATGFTETNSTTVTLSSGLNAGDQVIFLAISTIPVGSSPASQSTYTQGGTGAVTRDVQSKLREVVSVADFGAVADFNGTTGTNNTNAFVSAFNYLINNKGGILLIPEGDYFFGSYSAYAEIITISGLSNATIQAYGARFFINTTAAVTPVLFSFKNPNNVYFCGPYFSDVGFSETSWSQGVSGWGMDAVSVTATQASSGFSLIDCYGTNINSLFVSDQHSSSNLYYLMKNVRISGTLKTAYYGVDCLYSCQNIEVDLYCEDVRRGFISYGQKNFDVNLKLVCNANFLGSNAFVELACEGSQYGNVENGRIKVNVSGVEAHEGIVHFYHQQDNTTAGFIRGIETDIRINNLTTTGKNTALGPLNVFVFDNEYPVGTIDSSTTRSWDQITLNGSVTGSISGSIIHNPTVSSNPGALSVDSNLSALVDLSQFNNSFKIKSPYHAEFSPIVVGTTTSGAGTYSEQKGYYSVVDGVCKVYGHIAWTAHTGTGNISIDGLPFQIDTSKANLAIADIMPDGLPITAGTSATGLVGGAGNKQILLYQNNAGTNSYIPINNTGGIWFSASYPILNY